MSETLSQDPSHGPDTLTSGYTLAPSYPSATSISDPSGINLPPFSTFSADIEGNGSFGTFGDTRLLDISNWDCYTETRLDRSDNGISIITSQPQYRPWESKPVDTGGVTTFADAFASQNGSSPRLPSFQSQFQAFNDQVTTTETTTLTTLTPVSPSSTNQNITTLGNFHSLNPRNYPLVPAPIQAREIPSIQQQFIDERHIQLYTHSSGFSQNGAVIQNIGAPTVVTMLKSEPIHQLQGATGINIQNITTLHHNQLQNPLSTVIESNCSNNSYNHIEKKNTNVSGSIGNTGISPSKLDYRKKERRKARASSLESSNESDDASSNMDITSAENSGQVAAISSTASFKHQNNSIPSGITNTNAGSSDLLDADEISGCVDKQVKKKRKRCGECIGCQRKDNCGDCAPCRNDKSHQICKQRRCEKLTEKKNLYGENGFVRDGSRRGRGKSRRGGGSYRGRKAVANSESKITINAADSATAVNKGVLGMVGRGEKMSNSPSSTMQRPRLQDAHDLQKPSVTQSVPVIEAAGLTLPVATQQPITCSTIQQSASLSSVPFYTDPNRFTTSVWQTDPSATWTQSQFIQHLNSNSAPIETTYTSQQYPNSIYQPTVYTQPGFEPMTANTYYTGAVQVLTNRPPSVFTQQEHPQQLTTRACGSTASYTSSPSPSHQPSRPQSTHQLQYETYQLSSSVAMPQTSSDSHSRPSSVSSNATTPSIYTGSSQQQQNNPTYNLNVNNNASYVSASTTMRHVAPEAQGSRRGSPGSTTLDYRIERNEKHPQLSEEISLSSNEYPVSYNDDEIITNETHSKKWTNPETVIWESNNQQQNASNRCSDQEISRNSNQLIQHRVEINSKLKTMILKKYEKRIANEDEPNSKATGHFLLNSHRYCAIGQLNNGGNKYIRIMENSKIFWNSQTIKLRKISGSNMITSLTVVMKKIKRKWFEDSCLLMF